MFGSGETARVGRRVHEQLLAAYERPVRVAVVETPAGFQPNVDVLSSKVRTFFEHNLQNFKPEVTVVQARRRGDGPHGADDPTATDGIGEAAYIFAGAGSPTYAVRHLAETRLWAAIVDRLDDGATLALASAMALAAARHTLPVYEIYKVGADPCWSPGLDLFGADGLDLTIVPHWNNKEGGAELDTSRCYMGEARFAELRAQLPPSTMVLGIDEHTVCVVDRAAEEARVHGVGAVTVLRDDATETYADGDRFPLSRLRR